MDPTRRLRLLPPGAWLDLLRVLESPSNVRADVIRQFHERGEDGMECVESEPRRRLARHTPGVTSAVSSACSLA